ncbi:MAG: hypothetical protein EBY64_01880 [Rhodobacteraceae bacterium]|nr:hypothetical protein [Paracoccaceae bacterium]
MKLREIDARSWLIKYVKAKHNLPNYDKELRFAKSVNYIDENADVTETGRLLFEFSHCPRQGGVNSGKHSWTLGGVQ